MRSDIAATTSTISSHRSSRSNRPPPSRDSWADRSGRIGVSLIRARSHAMGPRSDRLDRSNQAGRRRALLLGVRAAPAGRPPRRRRQAPPPAARPGTAWRTGPASTGSSQASGWRPASSSASSARCAPGRSWTSAHRKTAVCITAISVTPGWDVIASPMPSQSSMLGLLG